MSRAKAALQDLDSRFMLPARGAKQQKAPRTTNLVKRLSAGEVAESRFSTIQEATSFCAFWSLFSALDSLPPGELRKRLRMSSSIVAIGIDRRSQNTRSSTERAMSMGMFSAALTEQFRVLASSSLPSIVLGAYDYVFSQEDINKVNN